MPHVYLFFMVIDKINKFLFIQFLQIIKFRASQINGTTHKYLF